LLSRPRRGRFSVRCEAATGQSGLDLWKRTSRDGSTELAEVRKGRRYVPLARARGQYCLKPQLRR